MNIKEGLVNGDFRVLGNFYCEGGLSITQIAQNAVDSTVPSAVSAAVTAQVNEIKKVKVVL